MELKDIRVGNYVKEHEFSSRGRALEPYYRVEYDDLAYHSFMVGVPIDLEWCKRLSMDIEEAMLHANANFDWIARAGGIKVVSYRKEITVFNSMGGCSSILEHIKYVHQLQNFFYTLWGFEIDEENTTEFYQEPKNEIN
jgi:hypothetical protein